MLCERKVSLRREDEGEECVRAAETHLVDGVGAVQMCQVSRVSGL